MNNYIVSARKYRPATFDTVIGQRALTTTLKNAIASQKLAHAYLFCGPRGVGKTTCARIFAKTINCLNPTENGEACNECESCKAFNEQRSYNIHELDAASNNSVEDIRTLIEQVRIPPQIGTYKVYIIDEVHMLSPSAFNAFLKTLEEPPHHAIFILATTEKHKILPTILSRCQIYDFNRIGVSDIVEHLENVAKKENIAAEPEALNIIAQKADGGMRDALSIFDQVVSFTNGNITYQSVINNLNVLDYEYYFQLTDFFLGNKVKEAMLAFNDILKKGFDGNHFITGLCSHFRDLLVSHDESTLSLLEVGASIKDRYREQAKKCDPKFLFRAMKICNNCDLNYRASRNKRLLVELTLIELAQLTQGTDDDSSGRSPKKIIKPIFNSLLAASGQGNNAIGQQNNQGGYAAGQAQQAAAQNQFAMPQNQYAAPPQANQSNTTQGAGARPAVHERPAMKPQQEQKIPLLKGSSLGFSIRNPHKHDDKTQQTATQKVAVSNESNWEDHIINDNDLSYYWREFANMLPKEEMANAGRMMNMKPALMKDGATFEVMVDNDMVQKYMMDLSARIEAHLRKQLHNRKIKMMVRVSEVNENRRAYSHLERYQLMSEKNPKLQKLKEELGLELS